MTTTTEALDEIRDYLDAPGYSVEERLDLIASVISPQTVYTVDVFQREDGLYVFASESDAKRFEDAVNGAEDTAYGSSCYRSTQTVVSDAETVAKLIASERDPDDERAAIPEGIAWPIKTDGCDPPEGWSWVERDDDADIYRFDSDAAEALIAAGIGTEWSYFDRVTHDRITGDEVVSTRAPIGTAVNVPEPDWFNDDRVSYEGEAS